MVGFKQGRAGDACGGGGGGCAHWVIGAGHGRAGRARGSTREAGWCVLELPDYNQTDTQPSLRMSVAHVRGESAMPPGGRAPPSRIDWHPGSHLPVAWTTMGQ